MRFHVTIKDTNDINLLKELLHHFKEVYMQKQEKGRLLISDNMDAFLANEIITYASVWRII